MPFVRRGLIGLCFSLSLLMPDSAVAQPAAWAVVRFPGTPEFLADTAGWRSSRLERVRLLRDLARHLYVSASSDEIIRQRVLAALQTLLDLREASDAVLSTGTPLDISDRSTRRTIEPILELIG